MRASLIARVKVGLHNPTASKRLYLDTVAVFL